MRGTGGIYRAGVALLVCGLLACGGGSDNGEMDASTRDAQVVDGGVVLDGRVIDGSLPASDGGTQDGAVNVPDATSSNMECADHHACKQGEFCHRGKCRLDAEPVYHCGKPGCPPGHWCVEADGKRATCANDPTYGCESACDCGPAHCCIDDDGDGKKSCVKDEGDPWLGTPGAPSLCPSGPDVPEAEREPTYCASAAECIVGQQNWAQSGRRGTFLAYDENAPAGEEPVRSCGKQGCYATACNCSPGQSCVDTVEVDVTTPGSTCGLFSSGTCVSHAAAESLYDFAPGELLECCSDTCTPGQACDMGWMHSGNKLAYQRITATCPGNTPCVCGDGTCCPEEIRACPQDCMPTNFTVANDGSQTPGAPIECGNGVCEHFEDNARCPADCPEACGDGECDYTETVDTCFTDCREECGDGWCSPTERVQGNCPSDCDNRCIDANFYSRVYRVCGDGVCDRTSTCDMQEPETCATCALDCGACDWEIVETGREGKVYGSLLDVWSNSDNDIYVSTKEGNVFHYDGSGWARFDLRPLEPGYFRDIWSAGADHAVLTSDNGVFLFDGKSWLALNAPAGGSFDTVWGEGRTSIVVAGSPGSYRFEAGKWSQIGTERLANIWGDPSGHIYGVTGDDSVLTFDGNSWSSTVAAAQPRLLHIWGTGPNDIVAAGHWTKTMGPNLVAQSMVSHFDGNSWGEIDPGQSVTVADVWSAGPDAIFIILVDGTLLRYNGASWTAYPSSTEFKARSIHGASANSVYAVGVRNYSQPRDPNEQAVLYHFDGTQWTELEVTSPSPNLSDVWGLDKDDFFVTNNSAKLYRYKGDSLTEAPSPISTTNPTRFESVWGASNDNLIVTGIAFEAVDKGLRLLPSTWQLQRGTWKKIPVQVGYQEVSGIDTQTIFLLSPSPFTAVDWNEINRYDGQSWTTIRYPLDVAAPHAAWGNRPDNVYFAANNVVYHCNASPCGDPQGFTQTTVDTEIIKIWGADDAHVFAIGQGGTVLHFDGESWVQKHEAEVALYDISGLSSAEVYAVGADGTVLEYDGTVWRAAQADLRRPEIGACPKVGALTNAGGTVVAVGADTLILRKNR